MSLHNGPQYTPSGAGTQWPPARPTSATTGSGGGAPQPGGGALTPGPRRMPTWLALTLTGVGVLLVIFIVAPLVIFGLARGAVGHVSGPSVRITDSLAGSTWDVTVGGGTATEQTKQHSAAPGRQFWTVKVKETNASAGPVSLALPVVMVAVPAEDTEVTPPGTQGWLKLRTAGTCAYAGVNGLLSGPGNQGMLSDWRTESVPEGFCLFPMTADAVVGDQSNTVEQGESLTLVYASMVDFTGDFPSDPTYFVAPAGLLGGAGGDWTQAR